MHHKHHFIQFFCLSSISYGMLYPCDKSIDLEIISHIITVIKVPFFIFTVIKVHILLRFAICSLFDPSIAGTSINC
jgi:hypothetical protein